MESAFPAGTANDHYLTNNVRGFQVDPPRAAFLPFGHPGHRGDDRRSGDLGERSVENESAVNV
jgi:hypothetical protein